MIFFAPSLLGERFYEVMFYFSSYVLRKVMVRDHSHGKESAVPHVCKKIARMPSMTSISSKAMLVKMLAEKNRFFENVQCDIEVQEHWKSHAMSSTKEYRKLCKANRELERKLNPTGSNVYLKERTGYVDEAEALRRTKQLQEVREHWSVLEMFHENTTEKRAILNEILEDCEPNFQLDGACIQLQIPDVLTTKYRHAIQMKNIKNTYEGGKLNLLSLVQLSTLSLHEMKKKIREDGIPDFEHFIPHVKHEVRTHGTYLTQVQNLRTSLKDDLIPELKKSIDDLKEECYTILDETVHLPVVSLESFEFGLGLLPATPSPAFTTSGHLTHSAGRMSEISLKKTPKSKATPDVIENLTSSIREMVLKGNELPGDKPKETAKTFVSRIPKPVNCRLSQTPDVDTKKSTAIRRRSFTTTKKSKRTRGDEIKTDTRQGFASPKQKAVRHESQRKQVGEQKSDVTITSTNDDQFRTPLATGTKSVFMTSHSSARNILAEKIAAAVLSDEPSSRVDSSQSSSGENTPKDLAIADPLGNLMREPFVSKDLIPRTPFKSDVFLSDESEKDTPGGSGINPSCESTRAQRTNYNVTPTSGHSPCADAANVNVSKSNNTEVQTQTSRVMSPNLTPSVSSSAKASTSDTVDTSTHVSSDIILKYQQLKKAQEQLKNDVSDLLQTPETFACPAVGSSDTISDKEDNRPLLQSSSCSYTTSSPDSTSVESTTNPVLLHYQQWKKDQKITASSATIVTTSPCLERAVDSASPRTEIMSDNPLLNYQMDSQVRDYQNPRLISDDAISTSEALKVTLSSLFLGNQGDASVSSPILQSPNLKVDDLLTPLVNGHHGLPRKLEGTVVTKDTNPTRPRQQATHVTYSKGFATPMMSFLGNHDMEQTPLEYIRPPIDFNSESLNQDRRESIRSRLSFDIVTPRSSLPMSSAQHAFLNTPTAREIANVKVDNVIGQRKFDLIPVNMDDLLEEDYQLLPFGEVAEDKEKNLKQDQRNSSIENKEKTHVSVDLTPHVKVGQLIDFD